jgi:rare lipoprotein A
MRPSYSSQFTSGMRLLGFVSLMVLTGCATTRQGDDLGSGRGAKVARDPHYNSGTLRPYTVRGTTYYPKIPPIGYSETGTASWYSEESPNPHTANGEVFMADGISAAHKTFPLPSVAEITNLDNGKTIRLRVNDRGPFVQGRIVDLTRGAAKALGVYRTGTARVKITFLGPAEGAAPVYAGPTYTASSGDDRRYIVQLGAFGQEANAEAAQDRLEDARIDRRGDLYIVFTGPYKGAAAAETHRQDAIDAGFSDAILVRSE